MIKSVLIGASIGAMIAAAILSGLILTIALGWVAINVLTVAIAYLCGRR